MNDTLAEFKPAGRASKIAAGFIATVVLIAAMLATAWMLRNRPRAERRPPMAQTPVADVQPLVRTNCIVRLEAMGVVLPAREVSLQAEVSGRIVSIHPQLKEGGLVRQGEELLRLDDRSYAATLKQKEAALKTAESNLQIEEGQQAVARADLELMETVVSESAVNRQLALREPQRHAAEAAVAAARAAVDEARLNIERTRILAPWNAVVLAANAEVGGQASPGNVLAHLAGAETFWIRAALPVDHLQWIRFPGDDDNESSSVTVLQGDDRTRSGTVLRRLPDLDAAARMARILISVSDPLGLERGDGAPPLLLNDYVSVRIEGSELRNVYRIPRSALRDGNFIWLMDAEHALRVHPVHFLWGTRDTVLIRDSLPAEHQLVLSALAAPVEGMKLRTAEEAGRRAQTAPDREPEVPDAQ
jgi:RND family efflux transporter MFP subunit